MVETFTADERKTFRYFRRLCENVNRSWWFTVLGTMSTYIRTNKCHDLYYLFKMLENYRISIIIQNNFMVLVIWTFLFTVTGKSYSFLWRGVYSQYTNIYDFIWKPFPNTECTWQKNATKPIYWNCNTDKASSFIRVGK